MKKFQKSFIFTFGGSKFNEKGSNQCPMVGWNAILTCKKWNSRWAITSQFYVLELSELIFIVSFYKPPPPDHRCTPGVRNRNNNVLIAVLKEKLPVQSFCSEFSLCPQASTLHFESVVSLNFLYFFFFTSGIFCSKFCKSIILFLPNFFHSIVVCRVKLHRGYR